MIGGAGTPPGVGLETRKADIAARGQYETRAAQMLVEQERQRNLLGSREGRADSEVTEKRKKLEEAKLLLAGAKDRKGQLDRDMEGLSADRPLTDKQRQRARGIDRAMQANEFFPRLGGSSDPALGGFGYVKESQETEDKRLRKLGGQDASADKKLKADLDYKGQIAAVEDAQLHLQEALNAQQALSVARGESLLEQQKERIGLMQVERDRLTGIIAQEKSRKEGAKVALGMQNPLMRKQLVGLAKSISEGKTLSERELQFASAHGGELFRPAVEEIARKRAGPEYDQIAKYLKSDEREKAAAEARVTLDQKITIELKDNAEAMAAVAAKRILPEIEGMMKLMIEQMILALEKYKVQQRLVNAPGAAQ